MLSANVIETGALYLTNLVKNGSSISSSYRTYGTPFYYTNWLIPEHTYYYSFKYNYTDPANSSQAPNYVLLFYADGYAPANGGTWFPVNGTSEQSFSGLFTPTTMWSNDAQGSWAYGSVYHKYQSENTTVTTSVAKMQLREVVVTDVTFLYQLFKGQGLTDAQCLTEINAYGTLNKFYDSYRVHEEVRYPLAEILQKLSIKKSYAYGNQFIECDGMVAYSCNKNNSTDCYFDKSDWLATYNNGGGSITRKRMIDTSSPFYPKHSYVLQVKSAVTNTSPSPGLGGIYNSVQPAKGDLIVEKLVAKVPVGYSIQCHNNSVAEGEIAPTIYNGTGNYEEYTFTYKIGSSGTPGTIGHIAVHANSNAPDTKNVTWYIAYINYCKLTDTGITDWSAFPGRVKVKSDKLYISEIDSQNLFLNGDGSDPNMPLPSKYQWVDGRNYDLAGWNAIMQPPTTTTGYDDSLYGKIQLVGPRMPINPLSRYKFSCRIWADGSKLSSFYLALPYYTSDNDSALLKASDVQYRPGTRTQLKANAAVGATTLTVNSTANWVAGIANSGVGFKSSVYRSYHDLGYQTFNSGIKSVSGNTITLSSGLTKAHQANEYVQQAQDGYQFYYPITGTQLPIKEWKEFEIYFGKPDQMWDGRGTSWVDIPWDARYIGFAPNIYSNNSGSPIIYDNIRIEEVYTPAEKKDQKVQIKHYNNRNGSVFDIGAVQHSIKLSSDLKSGFIVTVNNTDITKTTDVVYAKTGKTVNLSCSGSNIAQSGSNYVKYTFDKFSSGNTINKIISFEGKAANICYYTKVAENLKGNYKITFSGNIPASENPGDQFMGWSLIAYYTGKTTQYSPQDDIQLAVENGFVHNIYKLNDGTTSITFPNNGVDLVLYNAVSDAVYQWAVADYSIGIEYQKDISATAKLSISNVSVTISNNSFVMPNQDVAIGVNYASTTVYKVSVGSFTGGEVQISTDGKNFDFSDKYVTYGQRIYYKITPTNSQANTFAVSFQGISKDTKEGNFLVYYTGSITGSATYVTYYTISFSNLDLEKCYFQLQSEGTVYHPSSNNYTIKTTAGKKFVLSYEPKGYTEENKQYKNVFDSYSSNPSVEFSSNGGFTMPASNLVITINTTKIGSYAITVSDGSPLRIDAVDHAVPGETVTWNTSVADLEYAEINVNGETWNTCSGSFVMPENDVEFTSIVGDFELPVENTIENVLNTTENTFAILSLPGTPVSRVLRQNATVNNTQTRFWRGCFDELGSFWNSSELATIMQNAQNRAQEDKNNIYMDPEDVVEANPNMIWTNTHYISATFAVCPAPNGYNTLRIIAEYMSSETLMYEACEECSELSIDLNGAGDYSNGESTLIASCSQGDEWIIGHVYYSPNDIVLGKVCQRLHFYIEEGDQHYFVDYDYTQRPELAPNDVPDVPFVAGYCPKIMFNNCDGLLSYNGAKFSDYSYLDRQIILNKIVGQRMEINMGWNDAGSTKIQFGFATDILGNDGKLVGTFNFDPIIWNGKTVYKTPIMTLDYLRQFNMFDLVEDVDYSTLSINVLELYNQGIITEDQHNRLLGFDLFGGLYVTIGYLGTLFTFISNFATADYLPVGEIAQDATFLCGWEDSQLRSNGFDSEASGQSLKIQ